MANIQFVNNAWEEYLSWINDKATLKKINKLIKEYGKPTREETDENGYTNYYWEFNNLEIKAQCVIDVYIYFYRYWSNRRICKMVFY